MQPRIRPTAQRAGLASVVLALACDGPQSAFAPRGPAAAHIATLGWAMLAAATIVCVVVLALTGYALFRRRAAPADDAPPMRADVEADRRGTRWIVIAGGVIPAVVLVALFVGALFVLRATGPLARAPALVVEVEGVQYWWHVRYPGTDAALDGVTANELRIPVGVPVQIRLRSRDVIHSFWVPALHGKTDLIPGRETVTWLQADSAGVFRGQCAEYCGVQHARMALIVVALEPARFAAWLAEQRAPARAPTSAESADGARVFQARCAECHTVRGTPAAGTLGPDLTHVASRLTLAAGTIVNTPGHLAGWVANPQALKRGSSMPRVPLAPAELHAVLAYLAELR